MKKDTPRKIPTILVEVTSGLPHPGLKVLREGKVVGTVVAVMPVLAEMKMDVLSAELTTRERRLFAVVALENQNRIVKPGGLVGVK